MIAGISGYGLAGVNTTGIGLQDINNSESFPNEKITPPDRSGIPNLGRGNGGEGGPGSGNLAIGGVFGHDLQSKVVELNTAMVDLLQKIVENTTPSSSGGEEGSSGLGD